MLEYSDRGALLDMRINLIYYGGTLSRLNIRNIVAENIIYC